MHETMKLFITEKLKEKNKNVENVPSSEIAELFSVQCNLVDNQCQGKSEVLFILLIFYFLWLFVKCWTK